MRTRYKCAVCNLLTSGRVPVGSNHKERGDGTFRYPRKHKLNGRVCPGSYLEAIWVDIEAAWPKKEGLIT